MRVGLVVFANKWTGAGAVAEITCRTLHEVGVDARLLFVGGRNLERRLEDRPWGLPRLVKDRSPTRIRANLEAVKNLAMESDVVISHLPHDHLLCVAAGVHRRIPLIRAYRNPGHLRRDPYHAFLDRRISGALLGFSALENDLHQPLENIPKAFFPVPIEGRFHPADGSEWRRICEIPEGALVIGSIGKLARGRGFGLVLETASQLTVSAHVMVVGHGEHRPQLEERARELGLDHRVHWTGYQEEALPELFSMMDVILFTAPGSDWGHRAISEAQGCARPVVAAAIPGVEDLIEDDVSGRIAPSAPANLAQAVGELLGDPDKARRLGEAAAHAVEARRFAPVGRRVKGFLEIILKNTE
jgi:glycosyltransferase involved in cell wall biosynthesis